MKDLNTTTTFFSAAYANAAEPLLRELVESFQQLAQQAVIPQQFGASVTLAASGLPNLLAGEEVTTRVVHVALPVEAGAFVPALMESKLRVENRVLNRRGQPHYGAAWCLRAEASELVLDVDNSGLCDALMDAADDGKLVLLVQTPDGLRMKRLTEVFLGPPGDIGMLLQCSSMGASDQRRGRGPFHEEDEEEGELQFPGIGNGRPTWLVQHFGMIQSEQ